MVAKLTRLTQKIAAESCTICSSRSRPPVRERLDTHSYNAAKMCTWFCVSWLWWRI